MALHKLIESGGEYLPFARSKLAQLIEQSGGYDASRTWTLDTGHVIHIRVAGEEHFIHIRGSSPRYEFFTSDHIGYDRFSELQAQYPEDFSQWSHEYVLGTPGYATTEAGLPGEPTYLPHVAGHFTSALISAISAPSPIYSHVLTPPPKVNYTDEDKWKLLPTSFVEGMEVEGLKPILTPYAWQIQKFREALHWPGNGSSSMVSSAQIIAPGRGNTCNLSSAGVNKASYLAFSHSTLGAVVRYPDPSWMLDRGYDVMPTFLAKDTAIAKGPSYDEPGVWWRRAAVATSDIGGKFFICTDNIGRFQVYRVQNKAQREAKTTRIYQTLLSSQYKQFTPPYPSWVTLPGTPVNLNTSGEGDDAFDDACWLWSFNKDATKAAAIAFQSTTGPHYRAVGKPGAIQAQQYVENPVLGATPAREDTPGLVEFSIRIVETGENDLDFTVEFELLKQEHYTTNGRYFLEAAYILPGVQGVEQDQLVVSDIRCDIPATGYAFAEAGDPARWGSNAENATFLHSIEFMATYFVCSTVADDMTKKEIRRFQIRNNESMRFLDWDAYWLLDPIDRPSSVKAQDAHLIAHATFQSEATGLGVTGLSVGPLKYSRVAGSDNDHMNTRGYNGHLWSVDLRSLSFFTSYVDQIGLYSGYHLQAFGKTILKSDTPIVPSPADQAVLDAMSLGNVETGFGARMALPADVALRVYRFAQSYVMETAVWSGFNVHPAGHWSHAGPHGIDEEFDIVQAKGKARTSHKFLFNKAFAQTRTHDYYGQAFDDGLEDASGNGGSAGDVGSFRTNGIWITF